MFGYVDADDAEMENDDENNENRGEREMDVIPRVFVADNCRFWLYYGAIITQWWPWPMVIDHDNHDDDVGVMAMMQMMMMMKI